LGELKKPVGRLFKKMGASFTGSRGIDFKFITHHAQANPPGFA
jgi:hypothetical protein